VGIAFHVCAAPLLPHVFLLVVVVLLGAHASEREGEEEYANAFNEKRRINQRSRRDMSTTRVNTECDGRKEKIVEGVYMGKSSLSWRAYLREFSPLASRAPPLWRSETCGSLGKC